MLAFPLLEEVFSSAPKTGGNAAADRAVSLNVRGDSALFMFVVAELRRSYSELPVRWLCEGC